MAVSKGFLVHRNLIINIYKSLILVFINVLILNTIVLNTNLRQPQYIEDVLVLFI